MDVGDIGVLIYVYFDYDVLYRLDVLVLLDCLIGMYEFVDVWISGIADKYVIDSIFVIYDFRWINSYFGG